MRARTNFTIDAIALLGYLVSTNPASTGTPLHEWVSVGIALVAFVHLVLHWSWAVRTVRRFLGRIGRLSRMYLAIDALLLLTFVSVGLSGMMVSQSVLRPLGWVVAEDSVWHAVHSQSATVLLVLMGVHLGQHWRWITTAVRHRILRPLMGASADVSETRPHAERGARTTMAASLGGMRDLARHTAQAGLLVALIAGAVFGLASRPGIDLGVPWLTMPGGSGSGRTVEEAVAHDAGPDAGPSSAVKANDHTAQDTLTRAAVRGAHAFLLLGVAMLVTIGIDDTVRPRGR